MLEIKNATFSLASGIIVRDISFVAHDGELTAIVGRSGSGKTRLLGALLCFYPLDSGYVSVDGELVIPPTACFFRSKMAYVPQRLDLPNSLTVSELYDLSAETCAVKGTVPSKEKVLDAWRSLDLDSALWNSDLSVMPLAVVKRILLSFALSSARRILVVDEPTEFQSDADTSVILSLLRSAAEEGKVVLVTTKDERVEQVADTCVPV